MSFALPLVRSLAQPLARSIVASGGAFSPLSLAPALWLDGLDSSTVLNASALPAANGEQVATWMDKSGNGRHATQGTNSLRPLRSTGGLTFDGVDDIISASGIALEGPMTVFCVVNANESNTKQALVFNDSGSAYHFGVTDFNAAGDTEWAPSGIADYELDGGPISVTGRSDLFIALSGGEHLVSASWVFDATSASNTSIGNYNYEFCFKGVYRLLLIFDRTLTTEETANVTSYLMSSYGL